MWCTYLLLLYELVFILFMVYIYGIIFINLCMCSVMPDSVLPRAIAHQATLSMDVPGTNAGVGGRHLLQIILLTQGANLHLLHCRQTLYYCATREELSKCNIAKFINCFLDNRNFYMLWEISLYPEGLKIFSLFFLFCLIGVLFVF